MQPDGYAMRPGLPGQKGDEGKAGHPGPKGKKLLLSRLQSYLSILIQIEAFTE